MVAAKENAVKPIAHPNATRRVALIVDEYLSVNYLSIGWRRQWSSRTKIAANLLFDTGPDLVLPDEVLQDGRQVADDRDILSSTATVPDSGTSMKPSLPVSEKIIVEAAHFLIGSTISTPIIDAE